MTDPRVRERLPFVGTDDPFQAVALVRVRDVVEVHGPAPECDTSERPPFPRQLNSHTSILAAPPPMRQQEFHWGSDGRHEITTGRASPGGGRRGRRIECHRHRGAADRTRPGVHPPPRERAAARTSRFRDVVRVDADRMASVRRCGPRRGRLDRDRYRRRARRSDELRPRRRRGRAARRGGGARALGSRSRCSYAQG